MMGTKCTSCGKDLVIGDLGQKECSDCIFKNFFSDICIDNPQEMTKETELLPCPFCGSTAYVEDNHRHYNAAGKGKYTETDYGVRCENDDCFCTLGIDETTDYYGDMVYEFATEDAAIKAWNTRHKQGE